MILKDTTASYDDIPVVEDDQEPRRIYVIQVPRPQVGDVWDVRFELHVTNDDLRAKGVGVAAVTGLRVQNHYTNDRAGGVELLEENGGGNVGIEAHHWLISRSVLVEWDESKVVQLPDGSLYLKLFLMAKSTSWNAVPRAKLAIKPAGGFLQVRI